jgi:hypothetical protein
MTKMLAVLVKPNTERSVATALNQLGVVCILPTLTFHKRVSRHASKTVPVEKLAIPCTFFVSDDVLDIGFDRLRELIPNYRGVMRGDKSVLEFPRDQIDLFKTNCDYHSAGIDESDLGADGIPIKARDYVRICFGPFTGIEGFVDKITDGVADFTSSDINFASNAKIRLAFLEKIRDKTR